MASGSSSIGMRLDLSQKNIAGVVANIYAADRQCQREIRASTRRAGEFCRELTAFLAPRRSGFMARNVRTVYTRDGFGFETGWLARDFDAAGRPFYPPFQEHGTRYMAAQPSLYPAYKETQQFYLNDVRNSIRGAIARQAKGGVRSRVS